MGITKSFTYESLSANCECTVLCFILTELTQKPVFGNEITLFGGCETEGENGFFGHSA
jgi:hypothetical protein